MSRHFPGRALPRYAFLPGRHPHPERDVDGHSHDVDARGVDATPEETVRWGFELFLNGYYWEAHEAWERIWAKSLRDSQRSILMKGLILLAASGVKLRTGKADAAARHARRASSLLRRVVGIEGEKFAILCGVAPVDLAELADQIVLAPEPTDAAIGALPERALAFASLRTKQG